MIQGNGLFSSGSTKRAEPWTVSRGSRTGCSSLFGKGAGVGVASASPSASTSAALAMASSLTGSSSSGAPSRRGSALAKVAMVSASTLVE